MFRRNGRGESQKALSTGERLDRLEAAVQMHHELWKPVLDLVTSVGAEEEPLTQPPPQRSPPQPSPQPWRSMPRPTPGPCPAPSLQQHEAAEEGAAAAEGGGDDDGQRSWSSPQPSERSLAPGPSSPSPVHTARRQQPPPDLPELGRRLRALLRLPPEEQLAEWRADLEETCSGFVAKVAGACDELHRESAERIAADGQFACEVEALRQDLDALQDVSGKRSAEGSRDVRLLREDLAALAAEGGGAIATLAAHGGELERLRGALSGDCSRLMEFIDEERRRDGGLQIEEGRAEWLLRDVESWLRMLPRGQALESPPFAVQVPGVGQLSGLRFRFYPNGGPTATAADTCSFFLSHPNDMPWVQYELAVGRTLSGALDPIFAGIDNFCGLTPELTEVDGATAVRLSVRFLQPGRRGGGTPLRSSHAALAGPLRQSPQACGLWQTSNRQVA